MSQPSLSQRELIVLLALHFAAIAFAIDSMLPALPEIADALSPDSPNNAQLVLTSFVAGMGIATLFTGVLSDTFGRKPVVIAGLTLYAIAALVAAWSQELWLLLCARAIQGFGAAAPRVVGVAIVRDLYSGREMARIISFVMMIFTLVPAIAPTMGAVLIATWGWRSVFYSFVGFALLCGLWLTIRLPEPLPPSQRRPLRLAVLWAGVRELFAHPVVRVSLAVQAVCMGILFCNLSSIQPAFDKIFHRADSFPLWFGLIAVFAGTSAMLNARLVMRLGMRRLVAVSLVAQLIISLTVLGLTLAGLHGDPLFAVFVLWQFSLFFQIGLSIGNINAMAMEPVGHIAGLAASTAGGVGTIGGVLIAIPVGLMFNATLIPLAVAIVALSGLGVALMGHLARQEAAG